MYINIHIYIYLSRTFFLVRKSKFVYRQYKNRLRYLSKKKCQILEYSWNIIYVIRINILNKYSKKHSKTYLKYLSKRILLQGCLWLVIKNQL